MVKREPRDVLGVDAGASPAQVKAAWRRLARVHHPDLTGDDPAASRIATRQMAEINEAYAALTRERNGTGPHRSSGGAPFEAGSPRRRGGPPAPKPTRPVTGRVDTTGTYRARNQTVGGSRRATLPGHQPIRSEPSRREPPRASTPTGPLVRDRVRHFRRPPPPSLREAEDTVIHFGKFHDHTLGQIAAFEPSYIDWMAATVQDPGLVAAARVIQADLDGRGVARRTRPSAERGSRSD